jgi:ABC-type uncharacterized transport system auxiliary subunit
MRKATRHALIFSLLLNFLSACGPLFPPEVGRKQYYVIADSGNTPEIAPREDQLLVREAVGNAFIDSYRIIFGADAASRGFYQFAQWVEPPPKRITFLLLERLDRSGVFKSVSRVGSSVLGNRQVNIEVLEFFHDISSRPGEVVVHFRVELVDANSRALLAKEDFKQSIKLKKFNARGAVDAFSEAVNLMLDDIVVWLANQ